MGDVELQEGVICVHSPFPWEGQGCVLWDEVLENIEVAGKALSTL